MNDLIGTLLEPIPVLDHGFVRLVDAMPRLVEEGETADHAIVRAARVSYQGGTRTARSDRGLIRYLMRHRHTSPFEMVELKFHVKMPIFVARQWVRHRTASINEISARYSVLPEEAYVPDADAIRPQSSDNKQGRAEEGYGPEETARLQQTMVAANAASFEAYASLLASDVARETARGTLNVAVYTEWYWKANLLNTLRFLQLRMDPHAQYEIRVYADAMARIVEEIAPWTWEAFLAYWQQGVSLSDAQWATLQELLTEEQREQWRKTVEERTSPGEAREFAATLRKR